MSVLLMDAVARREIGVSFRPVVELTSGRITGFEAVARWNSSELGEVDPTLFIEAAEDAGLIHELGQIVLETSLDVVQTEVLAGRWGSRRLSVNLSAAQLSHPDLPARIGEALSTRESRHRPRRDPARRGVLCPRHLVRFSHGNPRRA